LQEEIVSEDLKLGIVGLDTSHVVAFTKILNDENHPLFIPGARVVAAYPSFSRDIHASYSRVEGYTQELGDNWGVEMVDSVSALCERVDAVMIESNDGRRHLREYKAVAKARKPCFIDKPLATSVSDAKEIARLASEAGTRVFSSSSLRLVPEIRAAAQDPEGIGDIEQVHVFSPASLEVTNPGLFWYGVHGVEMVYTLLGRGCREVTCLSRERGEVVVAEWEDGRRATLAATRLSTHAYGAVVHGSKGSRAFVCQLEDIYVPLVRSIVAFFHGCDPPVAVETTVEMMAFIEAALVSEGRPVPVLL
jgi:predicted dehydrogenase